ncbi:nuclear transport factor 2 family protein [Paractinoplanes durhamensis]|uniref:nuclear transport factor 2 family protein n=1 Tax=Paractinoplanes durhamensis TaxID=113563 RepID=UPI0031E416E2
MRRDEVGERVIVHRPILARRSVCAGAGVCIDMTPLETALACHRAWTAKDLDAAMACIADDIVCDAPAGRIEGKAAYRAFLEPFALSLVGTELLAAFGDEEKALLMYDTSSALVASAPGAECVTVVDGRITYSRFLFDRLPFHLARGGGQG